MVTGRGRENMKPEGKARQNLIGISSLNLKLWSEDVNSRRSLSN